MSKRYAIVDLETTGGRAARHRVTEVGIVIFDGEKIVETYETLVNPECSIPRGITEITGITMDMVADAPRFHEVAKRIVELTEGAIFVAHNARFDYSFLRAEFERLGYTFSRKQLCTVRLARKAFPGLKSYSLGKLIEHFGITVDARHRALADAAATTELLQRILGRRGSEDEIKTMVNLGIKESRLPKSLPLDRIMDLPEECGVYYFYDASGRVIYVGKSTNIKKRIAQHFADQTPKGHEIAKSVADLSYELTGSELVALLLESEEIKRLMPPINRALRGKRFNFAIHTYINSEGYRCFDVCRNTAQARKEKEIVSEYPSMSRAKGRLDHTRRHLELCSRFTHLYPSKSACFHFHIKQCRGACAGRETFEEYNLRALEALDHLRTVFDDDFILFDRGRTADEQAVVLVQEGRYSGFGYISTEESYRKDEVIAAVKTCTSYPDTARIIQRFMNDNPKAKMIAL